MVLRSQARMALSFADEKSTRRVGWKSSRWTTPEWPRKTCVQNPLGTSKTMTTLSAPPDATSVPVRSYASSTTGSLCAFHTRMHSLDGSRALVDELALALLLAVALALAVAVAVAVAVVAAVDALVVVVDGRWGNWRLQWRSCRLRPALTSCGRLGWSANAVKSSPSAAMVSTALPVARSRTLRCSPQTQTMKQPSSVTSTLPPV